MRVISGKYKGRRIYAPLGIRPTQDKVRKAIFDILGDMEGVSFLELFAGSGAVGLEAASLGAGDLAFVEYNRDCLQAIRKNIASFGLKTSGLYPYKVEEAIKLLHREKRRFDIVFLDPPYSKEQAPRLRPGLAQAGQGDSLAKKTLQILGAYDILAPNALIVVQHFKKDNLPDSVGGLTLLRQKRYGDTFLSVYQKEPGP